MGKSKSKSGCKGNIKFANSKKSKKFVRTCIKGECVDAVGGIHRVLGGRLNKAGICNAKDLSCKMRRMTKRKYLRFVMKVSYRPTMEFQTLQLFVTVVAVGLGTQVLLF